MNRSLKSVALGLLAVAGMLGVGVAQARSNVYLSVDVGVPMAYPQPVYVAPPAVVYAPPPVVYMPPRVVYVPRPVYVRPRPVYYYYDYGQPVYYNKGEHWRQRHHERDDDDD